MHSLKIKVHVRCSFLGMQSLNFHVDFKGQKSGWLSWYSDGLRIDDLGSNPGRVKIFFLLHVVQTGSWPNPATHPIGKAAEG
jgi:hypothetical protein